MNPGRVVTVDDGKPNTIGVVVTVAPTTARILIWNPRTGRWTSPLTVSLAVLGEPTNDNKAATSAIANIRRHFGVIPCGGTFGGTVRVWPKGVEP